MKVFRKIVHFIECLLPVLGLIGIQYVVAFAGMFIIMIVMAFQGRDFLLMASDDFMSGDTLMGLMVAAQAVMTLVAFLVYRFGLKNKSINKFDKTFSWHTIPALIMAFWGISILTSVALEVTYLISPTLIEEYSELMEDMGLSEVSVLAILSTVFLAPLSEELVFRGITLSLGRRFTKHFWLANIIQAVCFGVAHGNIVQGTYAFVLGLVLGYIYKVYNNIFVPMICHMLYNIMGGYLIGYVFGNSEELQILRFFIVLLLAAASVYAGIKLVNKEKNYSYNVENYNLRSEEYYEKANRPRNRKMKDSVTETNELMAESVQTDTVFQETAEVKAEDENVMEADIEVVSEASDASEEE